MRGNTHGCAVEKDTVRTAIIIEYEVAEAARNDCPP